MRLPICELCAKSGLLCPSCERQLSENRISALDVEMSKLIASMSDRYGLDAADFFKAVDTGRIILLLTKGDVGLLIGKQGCVVKNLTAELGKKVRIVEVSGDAHKTVSDIITPARLLGINTIFKPGGKGYRVRISRRDIERLPMDLETLNRALATLLEVETTVSFE